MKATSSPLSSGELLRVSIERGLSFLVDALKMVAVRDGTTIAIFQPGQVLHLTYACTFSGRQGGGRGVARHVRRCRPRPRSWGGVSLPNLSARRCRGRRHLIGLAGYACVPSDPSMIIRSRSGSRGFVQTLKFPITHSSASGGQEPEKDNRIFVPRCRDQFCVTEFLYRVRMTLAYSMSFWFSTRHSRLKLAFCIFAPP